MSELHMYQNDVIDTVIATSPEDALAVVNEWIGESYADGDDDRVFRLVRDDRPITLHEDDGPKTMTAREWCEHAGRCFLASTEF